MNIIEEFKEGGIAVHCDTEEKANAFLTLLHEHGFGWRSGQELTKINNYSIYKNTTCYIGDENDVQYSEMDFYKSRSYEIISFDEFMNEYNKEKGERKMKHKIGDKVKIKDDLIVDKYYGVCKFNEKMKQFRGKLATITCIDDYGEYKLNIDNGAWVWHDEMLEPIEEVKTKTNYEHYKEEINDFMNEKTGALQCFIRNCLMPDDNCNCAGVICANECFYKCIDWLNALYEEPKPKIKLTQFEYDILTSYKAIQNKFKGFKVLVALKKKGHFKDVDVEMTLEYILSNCEVVENEK